MFSRANLSWMAVGCAAWMAVSFHGCMTVLPYSPTVNITGQRCEKIWGLPRIFHTRSGVSTFQLEHWQLGLDSPRWQLFWWNGQKSTPSLLYGNGKRQWVRTGFYTQHACHPQSEIEHRLGEYGAAGVVPRLIVIESQPQNLLVEYSFKQCRELQRIKVEGNNVYSLQYFSEGDFVSASAQQFNSRRRWIERLANARHRVLR